MAQIDRSGKISLGDASLSVTEEGISAARAAGGTKGVDLWERDFKNQVFKRIIQTMTRLGWTCVMPEITAHDLKHYGGKVSAWSARRKRICHKGDLKADLETCGRSIDLKMFQNVNAPDRPDYDGRYQNDKEQHMPYLMRLEMERTRRRITKYLCNVFTDYELSPERYPKVGPKGITALEWKDHQTKSTGHYRPELGHAQISMKCNETARDGGTIKHGATVWFKDWRSKRLFKGTAFYDLNSSWFMVWGKYGHTVVQSHDIYTIQPENLRARLSHGEREKRLNSELNAAVKAMDFERAAVLRDILFPKSEPLFVVFHTGHQLYHKACFSGYAKTTHDAGKFNREQLDDFLGKGVTEDHLNQVIPMGELA